MKLRSFGENRGFWPLEVAFGQNLCTKDGGKNHKVDRGRDQIREFGHAHPKIVRFAILPFLPVLGLYYPQLTVQRN